MKKARREIQKEAKDAKHHEYRELEHTSKHAYDHHDQQREADI